MLDPMELLPHRPPLMLLAGILETGPETAAARVRVDPDGWYADADGAMPAWFGIELMAQTVAAYSGARKAILGEPPRMGYLLGTRSYTATRPAFPAGAELEVHSRITFQDPSGLSAFECRILLDGAEVAQAMLKTFEPQEPGSPAR